MKTLNVGIFVYNDVEVLDFVGPFEVFNAANTVAKQHLFNVFLFAEKEQVVYAGRNFKVLPDYDFAEMPRADILVIPGGIGHKVQMHNIPVLNWIKHEAEAASYVVSVCTGAFILGNTGMLNNCDATTHRDAYAEFENAFPWTRLIRDVTYVDHGKITTSGWISTAGIDLSMLVIGKIYGQEFAGKVAQMMEYNLDLKKLKTTSNIKSDKEPPNSSEESGL